MAKPYSNDLRQRVARAIASGGSCRAIAEQYEIAPSTVVKWSKRLRETGSAAPAKFGGYRTCTLEPHRTFVLAQLEEVYAQVQLVAVSIEEALLDEVGRDSRDGRLRQVRSPGQLRDPEAFVELRERLEDGGHQH